MPLQPAAPQTVPMDVGQGMLKLGRIPPLAAVAQHMANPARSASISTLAAIDGSFTRHISCGAPTGWRADTRAGPCARFDAARAADELERAGMSTTTSPGPGLLRQRAYRRGLGSPFRILEARTWFSALARALRPRACTPPNSTPAREANVVVSSRCTRLPQEWAEGVDGWVGVAAKRRPSPNPSAAQRPLRRIARRSTPNARKTSPSATGEGCPAPNVVESTVKVCAGSLGVF